MATSNRDRIDQGLQLLAAGLRPFVDSVMSAVRAGRAGLGGDARGAEQRTARDRHQLIRGMIRGSCSR